MSPFCTSGVSVVGNVTAGVMTSSPRAQAVLDLRAEQRGDHEQVGRGAGVDEIGRVAAEIVAHLLLELVRERPGGEPELEDAFDAEPQFLVVVDAARVGHFGLARHERLGRMGDLVVARDEAQDFFAQFGTVASEGVMGYSPLLHAAARCKRALIGHIHDLGDV